MNIKYLVLGLSELILSTYVLSNKYYLKSAMNLYLCYALSLGCLYDNPLTDSKGLGDRPVGCLW